jgi:hypothetical protein
MGRGKAAGEQGKIGSGEGAAWSPVGNERQWVGGGEGGIVGGEWPTDCRW